MHWLVGYLMTLCHLQNLSAVEWNVRCSEEYQLFVILHALYRFSRYSNKCRECLKIFTRILSQLFFFSFKFSTKFYMYFWSLPCVLHVQPHPLMCDDALTLNPLPQLLQHNLSCNISGLASERASLKSNVISWEFTWLSVYINCPRYLQICNAMVLKRKSWRCHGHVTNLK